MVVLNSFEFRSITIMKATLFFSLFVIKTSAFSYDIDSYLQTLESNKIYKIEDAIDLLPKNIRSHFTLSHHSNGLRETSYQEPGVIAFDPDGSFFVNIGHPNKFLGNEIEVLQFNKDKNKVELFTIEFPLQYDLNAKIIKPQKNPQKCLNCHGNEPLALWGQYAEWKGMYGSGKLVYQQFSHDHLQEIEKEQYQIFKASSLNISPYRSLIFDESYLESPFNATGVQLNNLKVRPNSHIGFITNRINALVLSDKILNSNYFKANKNLVLKNFLCTDYLFYKETIPSIVLDFGLSDIELSQMLNDGTNYTPALIGMNIINKLPMNSENNKLKELLKMDSLYSYHLYIYNQYSHLHKNYRFPIELLDYFKQIDQIMPYFTLDSNKELCEYLKRQ